MMDDCATWPARSGGFGLRYWLLLAYALQPLTTAVRFNPEAFIMISQPNRANVDAVMARCRRILRKT